MTIANHGLSVSATHRRFLDEALQMDSKKVNPGKSQEASFAAVLATIVSETGRDREPQPQQMILNKELISELLVKVKAKTDSQLLRIVTDEGNHDDTGLLFLDGLVPADSPSIKNQSSNIGQGTQKNDTKREARDLHAMIDQASITYGVDRRLIHSVIKAESNFRSNIISNKGALGLMQLMPNTARELGIQNPYDPWENIMGGTKYLKGLLDRYHGNWTLTLAAYNWGMGNVEKNPDKLPQETSSYISRIFRYYSESQA